VSAAGGEFRDPRILLPFILITLIWSSTWIVIKDQLGEVPPTWSVTYRFIIASAAMFAVARLSGAPLGIGRRGHMYAAALGIPQFFLNFNFVYAAEQYITSGLVAVVFALLLVPNSALAWLFFRQRVTGFFLIGSAVALAGVALLFVQEIRTSPLPTDRILIGIGLTLLGVLAASVANVMQVSEGMRSRPISSLLAWAMLYGVLLNATYAFATQGPPIFESRIGYWAGLIYLGLIASAIAFTFYFRIVRAIGPARAAYSSVLVPIIAMGISTIFEGYRWSLLAALGGLLAVAGLIIALQARRAAD
jgi:drug/metabolite transporter (DMT)-like permease